MATDDGSAQGATWPMPKFRFEVDLGTELTKVAFQEVTGMDVENQIIEYRKSNSPLFSVEKMPGITKYGNITMKRGIFVNDNSFWDWHQQIVMNTIARRTVLIKLLDEKGDVTMQWTLNNAWPTKITSTDLKSDGNEVAVDTIEIAHEQLIIANGSSDYPVSFYFTLSFPGVDAAFKEVSGISKELSVEEVVCGGENRFKYRLPTIATSQNLVLKRAIVPFGSLLVYWCASCIDQGLSSTIQPHNVILSLLDANGIVCMLWTFHNAYPVKYAVSDLNSQESGIVIESIELAYSYFDISPITAVANLFT